MQGWVLTVGREAIVVVLEAVAFEGTLEGSMPTICVTSSVAVDVVAVAFDCLVVVEYIDTPERRLRSVASTSMLDVTTRLGVRVSELEERDCE